MAKRNGTTRGTSSQTYNGYSAKQIQSWDKTTYLNKMAAMDSEIQSLSQDASEAPYFSTEYNEAVRKMNALERDMDKIVDIWNKKHK